MTISTQRKNSEQKKTVFISQKIRSHLLEWRISLKKALPLDGKQTITGKSLWKMKKKVIPSSQKINDDNNEFFLWKLFSAFSNNGFCYQWNSTDQKLGRKSIRASRVKDIRNTFPLYGKAVSTLKSLRKNWKNWGPLAGIWLIFKKWTPP